MFPWVVGCLPPLPRPPPSLGTTAAFATRPHKLKLNQLWPASRGVQGGGSRAGAGGKGQGVCGPFWEGRLQLTLKAVNVTRGLLCCARAAWVSCVLCCVLCAVCCVLCAVCCVLCCVWAAMDAGGGAHGTGPLPKPPEPPPGPAPQPPPGVEHQGSTTVTRTCSLSKALNASLPLLEDWVAWMGPDASLPALKGREGQQDPRLALGAYIDAEVLAMGAVTQRGSRFLEMWLRILASANDAPMPPPPPPAASASAGSASSAGGPPAPLPEGPLPEYREFMDPSFKWDLAIRASYAFHTTGSPGPYQPQDGYQAAVDR